VAAAEQLVDAERLRASGAEAEVKSLREELEELEEEARMMGEQARQLSEAGLEKERLRSELASCRRQLAEERKTFEAVEQSLLKESRELQAKALSSLAVVKEAKRTEVNSAKAARDIAMAKVANLEATVTTLQAELEGANKTSTECARLRQVADELECRVGALTKEHNSKHVEWERAMKGLEREKDAAHSRAREEKMRTEQEFMVRLQAVETRAVRAEASEAERRRQLDMVEERLQRKRARTSEDDSDNKSLELAKKETEVSWLRAQKLEVDSQVAVLRKENDQLQMQKRALERSVDSEKTRLTLEYEAKIAALQQQLCQ
jgi:hypothetical protein